MYVYVFMHMRRYVSMFVIVCLFVCLVGCLVFYARHVNFILMQICERKNLKILYHYYRSHFITTRGHLCCCSILI